jgi:hypothetical protein
MSGCSTLSKAICATWGTDQIQEFPMAFARRSVSDRLRGLRTI